MEKGKGQKDYSSPWFAETQAEPFLAHCLDPFTKALAAVEGFNGISVAPNYSAAPWTKLLLTLDNTVLLLRC